MKDVILMVRPALVAGTVCFAAACSRQGAKPVSVEKNAETVRGAVGWALDMPGERLRHGRLKTEPAGHEEPLVSTLATLTRTWGHGCNAEIDAAAADGQTATVTLALQVGSDGGLRGVRGGQPAGPRSTLETCLVTQATRSVGQGLRKEAAVPLQAWVALDFERATP